MTTIEIQLPASLAREVVRAGLLAPDRIESMFIKQLDADAFLTSLRSREETLEPMSMEEVQAEIDAYREERRAARRRTVGA